MFPGRYTPSTEGADASAILAFEPVLAFGAMLAFGAVLAQLDRFSITIRCSKLPGATI